MTPPALSRPGTADSSEVRLARAGADAAGAERLTFFSDAVVAIAITLLALELPVPHSGSAAAMLREMDGHLMAYIAFFISFMVIGGHWSAHHAVFRWAARIGGRARRLNLLWLMTLVLTPYITRLLIEGAGGDGFSLRFSLYALVQAVAGLLFAALVRDLRRGGLFRPGTPENAIDTALLGSAVTAAVFAISVPVAVVAGRWAFVIWLAMPLASRIASVLRRPRTLARAE